jgi:hypothetical protein
MAGPSWPSPLLRRRSPVCAARWSALSNLAGRLACLSSPSLDLGSSHGVVIDPPLHRHLHLVSTPGDPAAPKSCRAAGLRGDPPCDTEPPSARSCHLPDSFRPCRSSRLRRFAPPGTSQVYCTLKPIMGFARLQVFGARLFHHPRPDRSKLRSIRPPSRLPRGDPGPASPRRSSLAHPEMCSQASIATWQAGGILQPFPLALHPSKLFPRLQLFRVNRSLRPHTSRPRVLGKPSPQGRPECCSVGDYGPPRSVPSRRWSRVTSLPGAPRAE